MTNKVTIKLRGTDINVAEALEALNDQTAQLGTYEVTDLDVYGVGDFYRDTGALVTISLVELTNKGLDILRDQFPAVEFEVAG